MDLFVAEYSLIQKTFNVELLSSCISKNIENISLGTNTGFQIIGIGNYEQCSKICREFEEIFERPTTIVDSNILVSVNEKDFKCDCGGNVFSKTNKNTYICHGCGNVYETEEK